MSPLSAFAVALCACLTLAQPACRVASASEAPPKPPVPNTLLILGDSNAVSDHGWVVELAKLRPDDAVLNPSVAGNTLGFDNLDNPKLNTLRQLDRYLTEAQEAAASSPAGRVTDVLINLGTNDCKQVFDGRGDEVVANLVTLIARLRGHFAEHHPGSVVRLVVITPPPYGPDAVLQPKYRGGAARVAALVPRFRGVAEATGCVFVDVHTPLAEVFDDYAPDGVHMNARGQKLIAERVDAALETGDEMAGP